MSGESSGVLIGGAILVMAPVVVGAAAVAGLGYAAIKVGGFLGKHAVAYAKEKKREEELMISECSNELSAVYGKMRNFVNEQSDMHVRLVNDMAKEFNTAANESKKLNIKNVDLSKAEAYCTQSKKAIDQQIKVKTDTAKKNLEKESKNIISLCDRTINKINADKESIINWKNSTAEGLAFQKAAANNMLRDAKASVKVIESMSASTNNTGFKNKVAAIKRSYDLAEQLFYNEKYQAAFSSFNTIIRQSALAASEQVQDEMKLDLLEVELRTKLEYLYENMKSQRIVNFKDPTRKCNSEIKANLNKFSQGKYDKMLKNLEEKIEMLNCKSGKCTAYEIEREIRKFNDNLEPDAQYIIKKSQEIMFGFYERLHVLEIIADFMKKQDYSMQWAMSSGADLSQKLAVNFKQGVTGNTVSITLDNDFDAGDASKMAMDVLTYYGNGRPVTEKEKAVLREDLENALDRAGVKGKLNCSGDLNSPASDTRFKEKATVEKLEIKEKL